MVRERVKTKRTARLIAALFVVLSASVAFAEDPTGGTLNQSISTSAIPTPTKSGPSAPTDWREETEATCGMACRYHREVDNLNMQALYLITKISKIDAATKVTDGSRDDEARAALGAFCKTDTENLGDCFARYKDFQRIALTDIRSTMVKVNDAIARLTTGRKADGTVEDGTAISFATGQQALPYMPDVPTLSELEESYLAGKLKPNGATYSRAEIQKWSEDLVHSNPKAKFIDFNPKVVGNPYQTEPTSYSLSLEKRDGSGKSTGIDARATGTDFDNAVKKVHEFSTDKNIADGKVKVIAPSKKLKTDDKISYDALTHARSILNSKIKGDVKKTDETENRKLASDKDPKTKPSPGPSAAPLISDTNPNSGVSRDVRISGTDATRTPAKVYEDDEIVQRPPDMKNSRYIKYDLDDLMNNIDSSTK